MKQLKEESKQVPFRLERRPDSYYKIDTRFGRYGRSRRAYTAAARNLGLNVRENDGRRRRSRRTSPSED